jgi:hypothetical protein
MAYPIDITPSVADVAALLRARTKDINGEEIGTFNDDTRPTSSQTITLIEEAVADIQARMGGSPPPELAGAGKSAAAMMAACLVELSYFPEQVRTDRSAFQSYWELLQNKITALQEAARGLEPGGNLVSSTPIEVPWVDYIPPVVMPVEVAVAAEAAQVGGIVAATVDDRADVVDRDRHPTAEGADPPISDEDPLH